MTAVNVAQPVRGSGRECCPGHAKPVAGRQLIVGPTTVHSATRYNRTCLLVPRSTLHRSCDKIHCDRRLVAPTARDCRKRYQPRGTQVLVGCGWLSATDRSKNPRAAQ